jgi:hypothetical protein
MDVFLSVINLPICFKKPITLGKNFFGEVGKWGSGEVGKWGSGVVGNFPEFRFDKRYV